MEIIVNTQPSYPVFIEEGASRYLVQLLKEKTRAKKIAIVSDDMVFSLYGEKISALLEKDYTFVSFVFPHGEAQKTWDVLGRLLEFLAENALDRNDCLIALGGGVVGDLTGLAASLYLRGISFVAIPTTLLAQVDSSVGGKTAVDLPQGKNLVGSFYQPLAVLCDITFLSTLSQEEFSVGMAEVIKYALAFDKSLYQLLLAHNPANLAQIVARCVEIKKTVVEEDPFDLGLRQKLNFGHTFAHSIEKCSDYTTKHGMAVAVGMSMMYHLFCKEEAQKVDDLLISYHLPTTCSYGGEELYRGLTMDKKKRGNALSLIVPTAIGDCQIAPTPLDTMQNLCKEVCSRAN